jgi:hypothetical protein
MSALLDEIIAARKSRAIEIDEASGRTGGGGTFLIVKQQRED